MDCLTSSLNCTRSRWRTSRAEWWSFSLNLISAFCTRPRRFWNSISHISPRDLTAMSCHPLNRSEVTTKTSLVWPVTVRGSAPQHQEPSHEPRPHVVWASRMSGYFSLPLLGMPSGRREVCALVDLLGASRREPDRLGAPGLTPLLRVGLGSRQVQGAVELLPRLFICCSKRMVWSSNHMAASSFLPSLDQNTPKELAILPRMLSLTTTLTSSPRWGIPLLDMITISWALRGLLLAKLLSSPLPCMSRSAFAWSNFILWKRRSCCIGNV